MRGSSLAKACLLLTIGGFPHEARPHGQPPQPAPATWQEPSTTWSGAEEFLLELGKLDSTLTGVESTALRAASEHLDQARQFAAGNADPRSEAYHREALALKLRDALQQSPLLQSFDFTTNPMQMTDRELSAKERGRGAALLRIKRPGDDVVSFRTATYDARNTVESVRSFTIEVAAEGTTYILLHLPDMPIGESWHHFGIRAEGEQEPFHFDGIYCLVEPHGTLSVTTRTDSDIDGEWFMVRLTCDSTGRVFRPSDSLDLSDIMDDIAGWGSPYPRGSFAYHAPGPAKGLYWINDGDFQMSLPPGDYSILAYKGPEYTLSKSTVTVRSDETTKVDLNISRWIDMAALGWHSGDDHVHSQMLHSEDNDRLLAFANATDTNVVNVLEMGNDRRTFYQQRGFGPSHRIRMGRHILVPGQEDPRYQMGHAIGLNMTERIRDLRIYSLNDLWADALHSQGAIYGHAHVGHKAFNIERDMTMMIPRGKSDFSTIMQGSLGTELYYEFLDLGYRHPASAGTDTPYGTGIGSVRVYCHTGSEEVDADDWFDALVAGRSFVTQGPILFLEVNGELPGSVLSVDPTEPLRISIRAQGLPGDFAPAELMLIHNSEIVRREISDAAGDSIETEFDLSVPHGGWLAAMVRDVHGAVAHTSPIYLEAPGLRHWNHQRVPELLERRDATLDEIESLIAGIEEREAKGELWILDFWSRRVLENASDLRSRIEIVRTHLEELRRIHQLEEPLRKAPNHSNEQQGVQL